MEGECTVKELTVKENTLRQHSKNQISIDKIAFRIAYKYPHWSWGITSCTFNYIVLSCAKIINIGTNCRALAKGPQPQFCLVTKLIL